MQGKWGIPVDKVWGKIFKQHRRLATLLLLFYFLNLLFISLLGCAGSWLGSGFL